MKIYVDFDDLDAEDLPSNISNKYKLEVRSVNSGSEYKCDVVSLADHDAELLKNAKPKFNNKQFVYALYTDTDIIKGQIESFDYYSKSYLIFFGDDVGSDWIPQSMVFRTKKEAETKLKEQGENR